MTDQSSKTPHGRTMKHPHDAKNPDGSYDPAKLALGICSAIASFFTGEYNYVDGNEGEVTGNNAQQISSLLGVSCDPGDEFQINIRRKGK